MLWQSLIRIVEQRGCDVYLAATVAHAPFLTEECEAACGRCAEASDRRRPLFGNGPRSQARPVECRFVASHRASISRRHPLPTTPAC